MPTQTDESPFKRNNYGPSAPQEMPTPHDPSKWAKNS